MKVVLFCGGLGTRLREYSDTLPKPLVNIGARPILWHLMRYYAHFGHKEFVLALGYRGDLIREYFLKYNECLSSDFTFAEGGKKITVASPDISDWTIHFVDTGLHSNIGQRLLRVRKHLEGEPMFLANYSDGLAICRSIAPSRISRSPMRSPASSRCAPRRASTACIPGRMAWSRGWGR